MVAPRDDVNDSVTVVGGSYTAVVLAVMYVTYQQTTSVVKK